MFEIYSLVDKSDKYDNVYFNRICRQVTKLTIETTETIASIATVETIVTDATVGTVCASTTGGAGTNTRTNTVINWY